MHDYLLENEMNEEIRKGNIKKYFSLDQRKYIEFDTSKKYNVKKREFVKFDENGVGKCEVGFDILIDDRRIDSFIYFQK